MSPVPYHVVIVREQALSYGEALFNSGTLCVGGNKLSVWGFLFLASGEGAFASVPIALTMAVVAFVGDKGCLLSQCGLNLLGGIYELVV